MESEAGGFVGAWVGLETEGVPAASCGWEAVGGGGVGWDEEWLRLDGGQVRDIGESFGEWIR